ncbi:hypothetical protein [Nocardia farcinica]|uniref:hypothetical protein n=1 Tax=Nocardia farcinica TaxID=37329 RepID=UPI002458EEDC|nr:hypothetical protein [Nocardia farcinica]
MGWSIGYDKRWNRDIGYGVPAQCDHPDCTAEIDRGLAYVCGSRPYGGEHGCGLFLCSAHLLYTEVDDEMVQVCGRCLSDTEPFTPKPDVAEWLRHKLGDPSWEAWRGENPDQVAELRRQLTRSES